MGLSISIDLPSGSKDLVAECGALAIEFNLSAIRIQCGTVLPPPAEHHAV
jgi:hypothetical protein